MRAKRMHGWFRAMAAAAILATVWQSGCGPRFVDAGTFARNSGLDPGREGSLWTGFAPGARVLLAPSAAGGCIEQWAETRDGLEATPAPLEGSQVVATSSVRTVAAARIKAEEGGYLALALDDGTGGRVWVKIPGGSIPRCVWPLNEDLERASALRGSRTVFAPWRATCRSVRASGISVAATLLEAEAGLEMDVGGVALGEITVAPGGPARVPWIEIHGRTIRVRADTMRSCFAAAGSPEAAPPRSALAYLHLPEGRCRRHDDPGDEHLECTSSVGAWEGLAGNERVSLGLVRRTLGAVHLVGGRPVNGDRWARAVIAVETGSSRDADESRVYQALREAIPRALGRSDGTFRLADPGDPGVNTRIRVNVTRVSIGKLEERTETGSSQYQDGERIEPNPAKEEARQRMSQAELAVGQAEAQYQQDVQNFEVIVQQAADTCRNGCAMMDPNYQAACYSTCDVGVIAAQFARPTQDGINQAQAELAAAQNAYYAEPDTIAIPIMKDWTFKRRIYQREASAEVGIRVEAEGEEATEQRRSFGNSWSDYEVEADPQHNVEGHDAPSAWIREPGALVPLVGEAVAELAAAEIRNAAARAVLREARRASAALALDSRGGFEEVDAVAVSAGGGRLQQRLQTGTMDIGGDAPAVLPSQAIALDRDTCLLAVAVQGEGGGPLVMRTPSGSHGDLRRRTFAAAEICSDELRGDPPAVEALEVRGEGSGRVRWGFYRTARLQPGAGGGSEAEAAPAAVPKPVPGPAPAAAPAPVPAPGPAPAAAPAPVPAPGPAPAAAPAPAPAAEPGERATDAFPDLGSPKAAVRIAAIGLVVARQEQAAVPALLELAAADPDVGVRLKACRAVGELGGRGDVAALEEVRIGDKNRKVRKAAEQSIRKLIKQK